MKRFVAALCAVVALALMATEASARRIRIPILIPHGSSQPNGTLVKVQALPETFQHKGQHFDLGYYWPRSGAPQWVGYLSSQNYIHGPEGALEAWLAEEGIALPDVPDKSEAMTSAGTGGGGSGFVWALMIVGIVIWGLRKVMGIVLWGAVGAARGVARMAVEAPEAQPAWQKRAEARVTERSSAPRAAAVASPQPRTARPASARPVMAAPRGLAMAPAARASFGRR